jgi:hypothetical protein
LLFSCPDKSKFIHLLAQINSSGSIAIILGLFIKKIISKLTFLTMWDKGLFAGDYLQVTKSITQSVTLLKNKIRKPLNLCVLRFNEEAPPGYFAGMVEGKRSV